MPKSSKSLAQNIIDHKHPQDVTVATLKGKTALDATSL
jgi:hypothetical protein